MSLIKVANIKLAKPTSPPESGIGTMSMSDSLYTIYEDRDTRRCIVVKENMPNQTFKPKGIPFEAIESITYYNLEDAGVVSKSDHDEDGEPVKRGPGRPPKQHVLA